MAAKSTLEHSIDAEMSKLNNNEMIDENVKKFILDYSKSIQPIQLDQGIILENLN